MENLDMKLDSGFWLYVPTRGKFYQLGQRPGATQCFRFHFGGLVASYKGCS